MTLLELVVAVLVLAIGSLGALKAMDQSRRALGGAVPRLLAQVVAQNRAEELRLMGLSRGRSLPAQVQIGAHQVVVSLHSEATASGMIRVEITARIDAAPGAYLVTYLSPIIGGGS
jgi:general secretion pathway protein I